MPILVAESLEVMQDPLLPLLYPGGHTSVPQVLGAIAAALRRPEDPRPAPDWLVEYQRPIVRRLLPMLAQYRGALLAAPVGSGKTYMALAAASLWSSRPPGVLVPAALATQWERTAAALQIEIATWSHERLSRGTLPPWLARQERGLVIVDESHHFRNPATQRYRHLAPALRNRTVLLLTATPVVNRLADLAHQLLLAVRDDALCGAGITSLREHLCTATDSHPAIGTLVLATAELGYERPRRTDRRSRPASPSDASASLCEAIDALALSRNVAIAGLIRIVLLRALASSPAALAGALRRYRGLLLHAWEALGSGTAVDRSALRRFLGQTPDQLLMWELMPQSSQPSDLELSDLAVLDGLVDRVSALARIGDEKSSRLAGLLDDGWKTVVFTTARETVRYLRDRLPGSIAWCTGEAAGIGPSHLPRDAVLSWFRPGANGGGPRVLVATDVIAEGLDLQTARRIVHYDLPWTAVRLDQRDGRALRMGSRHRAVDVVRFDPPRAVAERLGQVSLLARKRRLPGRAGLTGRSSRMWLWRDRMAAGAGEGNLRGWTTVQGGAPGILAGFSISLPNQELASVVGWLDQHGSWTERPGIIEQKFAEAAAGVSMAPNEHDRKAALGRLGHVIKERLELLRRSRWTLPVMGSQASRLIERINRLAVHAVRDRDHGRLAGLERGLAFAARGHSAGEAAWIRELLALPDSQLVSQLALASPRPPDGVPRVRLHGLVIFTASTPPPGEA